jgi:small subunit ribosomal protein S6
MEQRVIMLLLASYKIKEANRPKGGANMRTYEIMFIVRPNIEEQDIKGVVKKYHEVLKSNKAAIKKEEELGKKEFAYEIKKYKSGYYFLILAEANDSNAIEEFDRLAQIDDNIIRHMIIKIEE